MKVGDEFEFTVIQDQTSTYSNNRQSAIRMKRLPSGTVQFEALVESDVSGFVSKEIPPQAWTNRSPTKSLNGAQTGNGDHLAEAGQISYQSGEGKKTVVFFLKDCDPKQFPKFGDKVSRLESLKKIHIKKLNKTKYLCG